MSVLEGTNVVQTQVNANKMSKAVFFHFFCGKRESDQIKVVFSQCNRYTDVQVNTPVKLTQVYLG